LYDGINISWICHTAVSAHYETILSFWLDIKPNTKHDAKNE